ncbi:MAG: radical SAM protein [Bacteroidota bacterium]|nr:radical SAM protein [Bacteroidota bacterium]
MQDQYNRNINYLRISVTDRCNLRCVYCMPPEGIQTFKHEDILSYEEMHDITVYLVEKGINKVRLTGGEPLVRQDIDKLVEMLSAIPEITDLSMTTNGILLEKFAHKLKSAGLQRVNVSLDSLNPDRYRKITRGGDVNQVLRGIKAAQNAGLNPIKINMVRNQLTLPEDELKLREFCQKNGLELRFIQEMNLKNGTFTYVEGGDGGNCKICNRLRLTANGLLKPCLFSDLAFDVREMGIEKALEMSLKQKPKAGSKSIKGHFNQIGG